MHIVHCGRTILKNADGSVRKPLKTSFVSRPPDDVAAFIAEPVMGEGGIIVPPLNYFKEVKKVLDRHGILFIADEVQSGFATYRKDVCHRALRR